MSKKILLVDDDLDDQMILQSAIQMIEPSHACSFASNGREALEYLETGGPYDLILLDLNMPLMNGFNTLETIKTMVRYKNIPAVIISTSTLSQDIERCKRHGASKYIVRPDNFRALLSELQYVLGDNFV